MEWISLNDFGQLDEIVSESQKGPVLIYKHSTRCNISRSAFDRLERHWDAAAAGEVKRYFLDLLAFRDLSARVAELFDVQHESPQILVIRNGKSVLDLSHYDIAFDRIRAVVKSEGANFM